MADNTVTLNIDITELVKPANRHFVTQVGVWDIVNREYSKYVEDPTYTMTFTDAEINFINHAVTQVAGNEILAPEEEEPEEEQKIINVDDPDNGEEPGNTEDPNNDVTPQE